MWLTLVLVSPNQMTPLHVAAQNGRFALVKLLVDKKVNINIKDNDGVSKVACSGLVLLI